MAIEGTHLDPNARSIWIDAYKVGSDVIFNKLTANGWEERVVTVDESFLAKMIASFYALQAEGDRVTVLKEHKIDGEHYGTVHDIRVAQAPSGEQWFQVRASFVPSVWEAYDDDRIVEFSPGFIPRLQNPHTGEEHENVLLEMTFTSMALQHTLRPPQQTNAAALVEWAAMNLMQGKVMKDEMKNAAVEEEAVEEAEVTEEEEVEMSYDDMKAALQAANEQLASLRAMLGEVEGEKEEAASLAASLEDRVKQLEDEGVRKDLNAAGVPVEHHGKLVNMRRVDRDIYAAAVKALAVKTPEVQAPIGRPGDVDVTGALTAASVLAEARKAGKDYNKGLVPWVASRYSTELAIEVGKLAESEHQAR